MPLKGSKQTSEHIAKRVASRKTAGNYKVSEAQRLKIKAWRATQIITDQHRYHMSLAHLDEKHHGWKGDKVSYRSLHSWVQRKLGTPKRCDICGITEINKRYQWANISRKYTRDLTDWKRMCISCHKKYDLDLIKKGAALIFKPTDIK